MQVYRTRAGERAMKIKVVIPPSVSGSFFSSSVYTGLSEAHACVLVASLHETNWSGLVASVCLQKARRTDSRKPENPSRFPPRWKKCVSSLKLGAGRMRVDHEYRR